MITLQDIYHDIAVSFPLTVWGLFVMNWLAKKVYNFALKKGYPDHSATYFGRKVIHILTVGFPTIILPFVLKEPFVSFFSGLGFAAYTYFLRKKNKLQKWYQVRENAHEVNFCIMWSFSMLVGWFLDKSFWLGVVPGLFIAFGDGVTGIVRNFKYKQRSKAWEGSLAMFSICLLIGAWRFGLAGIVAAFVATLFERLEFVDDNVSIVLSSFAILVIFYFFFPYLMIPLF